MLGAKPISVPAMRCPFGGEPSPVEYIWHSLLVLRECGRVLRPDGVVWWNVDDTYGHGTTGDAAVRLGRRFIGVELSPEYARVASERIEAVLAQPRLFSVLPIERAVQEKLM